MMTRDTNKETQIRTKAIELIVKQGFDGLSMHKLAKAASVSVATIYIYFKDREDLIQQLYTEEFQKMTEATLVNFNPEGPFDSGLKIQWMNRLKYWLDNPLSMTFMEQMKHSPLIDRSVIDRRFVDAMSLFVETAISRSELIPLRLEIYWAVAFAPLYQLVKFHISGTSMPGRPAFILDESQIDLTLSLVLKALKP